MAGLFFSVSRISVGRIEVGGGVLHREHEGRLVIADQNDSGPLGRDARARLVSRLDGLALFHVGFDGPAKGVRRGGRRIVEDDQAPGPWRPTSERDAVELAERLER